MNKEDIESALKKIELLTEYELPNYFKKLYRRYNGGLVNGIKLLKIEEIISEMIDSESRENETIKIKVDPENTIKKVCYTKTRVPFISDGTGNYIGIDYIPESEGISGQIINYGKDENLMKVFANTFEDFIKGISDLKNIDGKIFITDYLLKSEFDVRKENSNINSNLPKKVKPLDLKEIKKEKEYTITHNRVVKIDGNKLKDVVELFDKVLTYVKTDVRIVKYNIINLSYKIKNYLEYNSQILDNSKDFLESYEEISKAEIKGYSFNIKVNVEEAQNDKIKFVGNESIFIEIDNETVFIKYTQTIDTKAFRKGYKRLCKYFDELISK